MKIYSREQIKCKQSLDIYFQIDFKTQTAEITEKETSDRNSERYRFFH